jgi:hypothetical protein
MNPLLNSSIRSYSLPFIQLSRSITNKYLYVCGLLLLLGWSGQSYSQVPVAKDWDRTIGGTDNDYLQALVAASDGGYLLAGYSTSAPGADKTAANKGENDYWIVKLDSLGHKLWDKTLGGIGDDRLSAAVATADGGYLLGGTSSSGRSGDKSEETTGVWLVKTDADGTKQWDKVVGGGRLTAMLPDADGNVVLGGYGFHLIKINSAGDILWEKSYDVPGAGELVAVRATTDGGYLLAGTSSEPHEDYTIDNFWIVKTDADGTKQWDKNLGDVEQYGFFSGEYITFAPASDGGYLLGGIFHGGGDVLYWLVVKIDPDGNKQWQQTYGGIGDDELRSIQVLPNGNYLLAGIARTENANGNKYDNGAGYWLVEIDAEGNRLWDRAFSGDIHDQFTSIIPTPDGNYLVGGYASSGIGRDKSEPNRRDDPDNLWESYDYWVVKTKPTTAENALITSLTLVNADTNEDIRTIGGFDDIDITALPTMNLNIRANTYPRNISQVVFEINGRRTVERHFPYAIGGDYYPDTTNYRAWQLPWGHNELKVTLYTMVDGQLVAANSLRIWFDVRGYFVQSFTLINADMDEDIGELKTGDVIDYAQIGTRSINIRANTFPRQVGSVVFTLNRQRRIIENHWPYAIGGDHYPDTTNYKAFPLVPGDYFLEARPYPMGSGRGTPGGYRSIQFRVVNSATARIGGEAGAEVSVYPNPFTNRITLQIGHQSGPLQVQLMDAVGKVHYTATHTAANGQLELSLQASLKPGMYLLNVRSSNASNVLKLIKQ